MVAPGGLSVDEIYTLFPNLRERASTAQGTKLSGGEQQMLAIGRILRTGAKMLLLDEPTEGLAPVIVQQIGRTIREIKARGFTVLLVEQNFRFAATVADRHYVMEHGQIIDMIRTRSSKPAWTSCTIIWASEARSVASGPCKRDMPMTVSRHALLGSAALAAVPSVVRLHAQVLSTDVPGPRHPIGTEVLCSPYSASPDHSCSANCCWA